MCVDRTSLAAFALLPFCLLILAVVFSGAGVLGDPYGYFLVLLLVLILGNYIVIQRDSNDLDFSCYKTYVIKTRLMTSFFLW